MRFLRNHKKILCYSRVYPNLGLRRPYDLVGSCQRATELAVIYKINVSFDTLYIYIHYIQH